MVSKKKSSKKSNKNFVVRFHSNLGDSDNQYDSPMFWSESGHGWDTIGSATRYSEGGADKIMLELLRDDKIATELIDLNDKPVNLFSLHTAFLNDDGVPQVITKVPQFHRDTYLLVPSGESWSEEDLMDSLRKEEFEILWDSNISTVPDSHSVWFEELEKEWKRGK